MYGNFKRENREILLVSIRVILSWTIGFSQPDQRRNIPLVTVAFGARMKRTLPGIEQFIEKSKERMAYKTACNPCERRPRHLFTSHPVN